MRGIQLRWVMRKRLKPEYSLQLGVHRLYGDVLLFAVLSGIEVNTQSLYFSKINIELTIIPTKNIKNM